MTSALRGEGNPLGAEQILRELLAARERLFGHEHPAVTDTCYELALALRDQSKLDEALLFARRAAAALKHASTSAHPTPVEMEALLTSLGEPPEAHLHGH